MFNRIRRVSGLIFRGDSAAVSLQLAVEQVDHLPQSADGSTIRTEGEAGQLCEVFIVRFDSVSFCAFDAPFGTDITEFVIESLQQMVIGGNVQSEHEAFTDESHAVVDAVEPEHFFDGLFNTVSHFEE